MLSVNRPFDLILLDTMIQKMNGIEMVERLRQKNQNAKIIFVTDHLQYAPLGYEVKAFRYILKSEIDDKLEEALGAFINLYERLCNRITLTIGNRVATILVENIRYITSDAHRAHFHFNDREDIRTVYKTLDEIEALLPTDAFLRIHQSYLVNLRHIVNLYGYAATLTNGDTLPVAQKRYPDVKRKYHLYRGDACARG